MAEPYEVIEVFLKPMKRLFARPLHSVEADESAVMGEYIEALKPFSKAALETGWRSIAHGQTGRFWPTIAICLKACHAAQHAFRETERAKKPGEPKAISGRMVDGVWQPWVGCQCARCIEAQAKYHDDNAWWYEFCARRYGDAGLTANQKAAVLRAEQKRKSPYRPGVDE